MDAIEAPLDLHGSHFAQSTTIPLRNGRKTAAEVDPYIDDMMD